MQKVRITSVPDIRIGTLWNRNKMVSENYELYLSQISNLTYWPDPNFFGEVYFEWQGYDGSNYSNTGEMKVIIKEKYSG